MPYDCEFEFHGMRIRLQTDSEALAQHLHAHWLTQCWVSKPASAAVDVVIRIEKAVRANLLKNTDSPVPGVTVLAAASNYYASLDRRAEPWQGLLQFRRVQNWEGFLLSVFAPFLGHIFRHKNFFELHSGAVALGDHGVILPAKMGSGKTTTVVSLIRGGFDFIADDHVYLRPEGESVQVYGYPKHPALLDDSVERFPELHFLKNTADILRGGRKKKLLPLEQVERLYGPRKPKAALKTILFPRVDRRRKVSLKPLSAQETLLWMMRQEPWDYYGVIKDPASVARQLTLFRKIAETARAYILFLNPDIAEIPKVVRGAVLTPAPAAENHASLQPQLAV